MVVQHFMYGADWLEGCKSCSFWADNLQGAIAHLQARDVSYVAVSQAPLSVLLPFKQRMGWQMDWVSSVNTNLRVVPRTISQPTWGGSAWYPTISIEVGGLLSAPLETDQCRFPGLRMPQVGDSFAVAQRQYGLTISGQIDHFVTLHPATRHER